MENPFFSLDIGSALMTLLVIGVWLMVVKTIVGVFARLALTVIAAFVILWAVGQADDVAAIAVSIVTTTWNVLVSLWNDIF